MALRPNVLVVNPELPVNSVKELIALAKKKPGKLQYASAGVGSFQHLGGELFKLMAGVDILHVPFKGGGPAMIDVVGGHTKVMFCLAGHDHAAHQVRQAPGAGRRRGESASAVLPDAPTIAEAGVPGYEAENWCGIVAPAGTPASRSSTNCTRRFRRRRNHPSARSNSRQGGRHDRMSYGRVRRTSW